MSSTRAVSDAVRRMLPLWCAHSFLLPWQVYWDASYVSPHAAFTSAADAAALWRRCRFHSPFPDSLDGFVRSNSDKSDEVEKELIKYEIADAGKGPTDSVFFPKDQVRLLYRAMLAVPWADRLAPSRDDRPLRSLDVRNPEIINDPALPSTRLAAGTTGVPEVDEEAEAKQRATKITGPTHALVEGNHADLACCSAGPELVFLHDPVAVARLCAWRGAVNCTPLHHACTFYLPSRAQGPASTR